MESVGSLIFIPSGVPHHNWNEGGDPEVHLEIIAPAPLPTQPIAESTESAGRLGVHGVVHEVALQVRQRLRAVREVPDRQDYAYVHVQSSSPSPGLGPPTGGLCLGARYPRCDVSSCQFWRIRLPATICEPCAEVC